MSKTLNLTTGTYKRGTEEKKRRLRVGNIIENTRNDGSSYESIALDAAAIFAMAEIARIKLQGGGDSTIWLEVYETDNNQGNQQQPPVQQQAPQQQGFNNMPDNSQQNTGYYQH